jgi:hypothetical protein
MKHCFEILRKDQGQQRGPLIPPEKLERVFERREFTRSYPLQLAVPRRAHGERQFERFGKRDVPGLLAGQTRFLLALVEL